MTTETLNTISSKKALIKYFYEHDIGFNKRCDKDYRGHGTCKHINYFIIPLEQYEPNTLTVIRYAKCMYCNCLHYTYIVQFEISPRVTKYKLSQKALTALRTGVNHEKFEEFLKNDDLYIQKSWIGNTWKKVHNAKQLYIYENLH